MLLNPSPDHFSVDFHVPLDNSPVSLEIIDLMGNVVKKVVDNPHAKGNWTYPIRDMELQSSTIYFCRLRVNNTFLVKKIIRN